MVSLLQEWVDHMKQAHMEYHEGYRVCRHCGVKVGARAIRKGNHLSNGYLNTLMVSHLRLHDPKPPSVYRRKCFLCNGLELKPGAVRDRMRNNRSWSMSYKIRFGWYRPSKTFFWYDTIYNMSVIPSAYVSQPSSGMTMI